MAHKFVCVLCSNRNFVGLNNYLSHLRIRHASCANFRVVCGISNCLREYDKYSSFYKHITRCHCDVVRNDPESHNFVHSPLNGDDDEVMSCDDDDEYSESHSAPIDVPQLQQKLCSELSESMLKYSLKLREKFLLPASTHVGIMDDCKTLISSVLSCQRDVLNSHLKNQGLNIQDTELQNILDPNKYDHILNECSSSYKLKQNCCSKLGMIEPVVHTVGNYKGYYVPLTKVLQMLVLKEDITPFVLRPCLSDDVHMTSFTSGDAFKSLAGLKTDGHLLLIHLYNDEFEVVNPIGSKRGKHKINATYFTLGNLPSKFRSSLQHIYVTNMIRHKAVKENGYHSTFEPLVHELEMLFKEGFVVKLPNGDTEKFYAILCTVSGDNLSSHALGGFRQVFNSGRVCRMCMVSHNELSDKVCEQDVIMRNASTHAYHLSAVKDNPDNAAIYGVTGPSVFDSLQYFDVTSVFPPDVMHDCLEGVVPVVVVAIIKRIVSEKIVSLSQINRNISEFGFKGSDRVNKPEPIKNDCTFIGSATQKMCLFRLLPFFIPLSKCQCALKLYVLCRDVMMFAFSKCISRDDLDYFQQRLECLRCYIRDSFPEIHVTPKFHFLIHYPTMMAKYGPLRNLWCMRFEAKHQYFKSVASSLGNFINIAFTLTKRHQMLQCYMFSTNEALGPEISKPDCGKLVSYTSLALEVQRCVCFASGEIWSVTEVTVAGCTYSVGAAIVVDFTDDDVPVFLQITHIFFPHAGHIDLVGKLLLPSAFEKSLYAYEVIDSGFIQFHPGMEKDCVLLWPYDVQCKTYIGLPYNIPRWSCI